MVRTRNKKTLTKKRYKLRDRQETDGQYLLKLVLVILMGTAWLKFATPLMLGPVPVAGLPIGMLFAFLAIRRFEKRQADRKIWYAMLIVVTLICYFVPAGIMI